MSSETLTPDIIVPPVPARERWGKYLFWLVLALLLAWSFNSAEMYRAPSLVTDAGNMGKYASGFLQPNFTDWRFYLSEMVVTVQIAVWGTFLAVIVGMPLSLLCSNNVAPVWVVQPMRRLMDACRSINELVFAVLFVVAVGLGPFAGVMAIFIHTTGIVAKLFSEAVEASDPRPVEGIRATGATRSPGSYLRHRSAGHAAVAFLQPLPLRIECARRHGSGHCRRRRHRPGAVRDPSADFTTPKRRP